MAELKPCPCPLCGSRLKKKKTVRGEIVYDHPLNGCKEEVTRVREYAVDDWNRRAEKHCKLCVNCIHHGTCCREGNKKAYNGDLDISRCDYFKDKSRFIELPCKVGDTVYEIAKEGKMRLIDADALIENHFSDEHRIALSYADKLWMRRIISDEPTIDAVPVVRCKDCQHYIDGHCYVKNRKPFSYDVNIHSCKENDFCSYGERKEDAP